MGNRSTMCKIEGCSKPGKLTLGWCPMHYQRWRRNGTPDVKPEPTKIVKTVEEHFIGNVSSADSNGCILWTGTINPQGYGYFSVRGVSKLAHRELYKTTVAAIPNGLVLDHTCHTRDTTCSDGNACKHRRCVNVLHLEPVTNRENILRGRGVTAINASKTHCIRNHPFSVENTYMYRGNRRCRACRAAR